MIKNAYVNHYLWYCDDVEHTWRININDEIIRKWLQWLLMIKATDNAANLMPWTILNIDNIVAGNNPSDFPEKVGKKKKKKPSNDWPIGFATIASGSLWFEQPKWGSGFNIGFTSRNGLVLRNMDKGLLRHGHGRKQMNQYIYISLSLYCRYMCIWSRPRSFWGYSSAVTATKGWRCDLKIMSFCHRTKVGTWMHLGPGRFEKTHVFDRLAPGELCQTSRPGAPSSHRWDQNTSKPWLIFTWK